MSKTGKCYTCGRPIWMDDSYCWHHKAPDDWIDRLYKPGGETTHPLNEPAHTFDKYGKKQYLTL